jgi:hypothetical protein
MQEEQGLLFFLFIFHAKNKQNKKEKCWVVWRRCISQRTASAQPASHRRHPSPARPVSWSSAFLYAFCRCSDGILFYFLMKMKQLLQQQQ